MYTFVAVTMSSTGMLLHVVQHSYHNLLLIATMHQSLDAIFGTLIDISYGTPSFKSWRRSLLGNVGCKGTESNLTECCATEILYCPSGAYAGIRCMCGYLYSLKLYSNY